MPTRQPFTTLCHQLAQLQPTSQARVDLHLHTTHSDGTYEPADVVSLADRSGLHAIAITDHDTVSGVRPAQEAAQGINLQVLSGVEISCEHHERELHLLGYDFDLENSALSRALREVRDARAIRFVKLIEGLRAVGIRWEISETKLGWKIHSENGTVSQIPAKSHVSLGRRTVADLLVKHRQVSTAREAFVRYLKDGGRVEVTKRRLPVESAIRLVHQAGGVTSWAHPPSRTTFADIVELRKMGLDALEVEYPHFRRRRTRQLRQWAAELSLAVTGGSDCHGPENPRQAIGCRGVTVEELSRLGDRQGKGRFEARSSSGLN